MSTLGPTPPPSSTGEAGNAAAPARQMRLKIAYSFDSNDKANCLARWPNVVNTPVVQVDDMLVGAVELKICILTIISSSPELVATLGQDYSVYAHDYSEPGIPLVGCGLLSWAILNAQNSSTRIMVTGRVNRNTFGFFSNDGVKETLEVKLRLQKIDTFTQEQFVQSVRTYTTISKALPGEFDASTWSSFLQSNPQILESRPLEALPLPPSEPSIPIPVPHCSESQAPWKPSELQEDSQPPKKKARTVTRRKQAGGGVNSRKKVSLNETKAAASTSTQECSAISISNLPMPPTAWSAPPHLEGREASLPLPPLSRESSTLLPLLPTGAEISPSPQNTNVPASSPPTQEDTPSMAPEEHSPTPTSPMLPSLPAPPRTVQPQATRQVEEIPVKVEPPSEVPPSEPAQFPNLILPSAAVSVSATQPDDGAISAAPSPDSTQLVSKPKNPKRKSAVRRSQSVLLPSEAIPSSDVDGQVAKPAAVKKSRTAAHAKQRIEKQLLEALKKGEMPNYCRNCGAIETAVWRKVKIDTATENSIAQTGDTDPKKAMDKDGQVLLCNPCGLWFSTHKAMRPQELWDAKKDDTANSRSRKRKKSVATPVPEQLDVQPSEPRAEPIVVPDEDEESTQSQSFDIRKRAAMTPSGNRVMKFINPEWNAAIIAGQRHAQSSPVLAGSAASPIDLDGVCDEQPSPRRLLFQPRIADSPRTLDETKALDTRADSVGQSDKENVAPDELIDGNEIVRPSTPVKNTSVALLPRTPLRSVSKSGHMGSPWNSSLFGSGKRSTSGGVPATPERRLAKSPQQRNPLSPTADLLEKLLAAGNPDDILSFDMDDDFWTTGIPTDPAMPSSPPRQFDLFKDPMDNVSRGMLGIEGGEWCEIVPSSPSALSFDINSDGNSKDGAGPVVDLSAFLGEALTHMTASSSVTDGNMSS